MTNSLGVIALIITFAALSVASSVFAPLAFAAFAIAVIWPVQARLQRHVPRILGVAASMILLGIAFAAVGSLVSWGFGRVIRAIVADPGRFQVAYDQMSVWLDQHGIVVATLWTEHFNVSWLIRVLQNVTARLNSTMAFWVVVFVYVLLGLLEFEDLKARIISMPNRTASQILRTAGEETARKIRRYMLVRSQMSAVTGVLVAAVAYASGLSLYMEWGVIAFALNFIPFLGPLIATLLPTTFAMAELGSWQAAVLVFTTLNAIQFVVGSYMEPRISGKALSLSPLLVLFSVFFWSYLWGIYGAFLGVPMTIAMLTFAAQFKSTAWVAHLLAGGNAEPSVHDEL
jgi:AI-2 transport protein TqsA